MPPQITEAQIRSRATDQSYARGRSYYNSGAIFATVRRGNEIEGRCEGSDVVPYRVSATLAETGGIVMAMCTCPYDWGGDCKHIVALLLTYMDDPDSFVEQATVQESLTQRSKEDLVALIRQMVNRYPDLQALVDRPTPSQHTRTMPLDTNTFRRELRYAMDHYGGWGDASAVHTVDSIAHTARQFADTGDWRSASAIYRAVIEEGVRGDYYFDDEGDFLMALESVLQRLVACLEQPELADDETEHQAILDSLLEAFIWNIDQGGYGLSDSVMPEALLEHAKPDDIPAIRSRLEEARERKSQKPYGQWGVEAYEDLLMQLDALESVDPEETLRRLRAQGMYRLLFQKLLDMNRADEAIKVIEEHLTTPYERLTVLPVLTAAGHDDTAIRLGEATLHAGHDHRLAYWLAERYKARGNWEPYFQLQLRNMEADPAIGYYAQLKEAALALGNWETVRPEIIRKLEHGKHFDVLTRAYLHDEAWDDAWRTLEKVPQRAYGWGTGLELEVADCSRHACPDKAIPVYIQCARAQIHRKERKYYQQAAVYLDVVRDLYRQIGDEDAWHDLIAGIRAEFRNLPALQDELNKAKL